MKTKILPALVAIILTAGIAGLRAQPGPNPPDRMSYQGFLVDANGNALGNTNTGPKNYDVIFRIFPAQSGGAILWAEQQTVTVDKGFFSVLLGEGSTVPAQPKPTLSDLFNDSDASDRFVEMTVKGIGSGGSDVTILPRLRLLSSPYAYLAQNAISAANLVNNSNAQIVSITSTNVGINKTSPNSALDVNGTVTASAFSGSGSNIVNINAANITSGTLADARLGANVALLNRGPLNFAGNIGINTTVGPGPNNLQIGNNYHTANGYGLLVCSPTYGVDIQIQKTAGQGGNALIVDNSANGDGSTSLLLLRNNVANSPTAAMEVKADGTATFNNGVYSANNYSGFYVADRGNPAAYWTFYSRGDRATFYRNGIGDRMTIDTSGNVRATGSFIGNTGPDIAETISAADDVEPGDIVCADPKKRESVVRCSRTSRALLGIVSDGSGGFLINAHGKAVDGPLTGVPLVLAGRIPVKVCLENGSIKIGDRLEPSSTPGVAMRAAGSGAAVGIALDSFDGASAKDGIGKVLCFLQVSQKDTEIQDLKAEINSLRALVEQLAKTQKSNEQ